MNPTDSLRLQHWQSEQAYFADHQRELAAAEQRAMQRHEEEEDERS